VPDQLCHNPDCPYWLPGTVGHHHVLQREPEEVSGTGYQRRPIKWTTVESPMSADELVALQEDAEAAAILDVLRRFAAGG
jgi:adenosyl cobinamide kinase/adenosyl cobinamide phosphate guanylyltransferase